MTTNVPTQEAAFREIMARVERQSLTSSDLTPDEITDYLHELYDPTKVSGPRYFYSQDEYGMPIARIPNTNDADTFCTVADINTLEARHWADQSKPRTFRGGAWPPQSLSDLTGSPQQSEYCVECRTEGSPCTGGSCNQQSFSDASRDFWLRSVLLRQVGDRGVGAFAREAMPDETDVSELAGRILPHQRGGEETYYDTKISIGTIPDVNDALIDLKSTGSVARYLNHSCVPNCKFFEGRCGNSYRIVWVQTTRAIAKGEELTVDYGPGWFDSPKEYCLCGEVGCRNPAPTEQATTPETDPLADARPADQGVPRTCANPGHRNEGKSAGLSDEQPICKNCRQREKDANTTYTCKGCKSDKHGRYQGGKAGPLCRPCFNRMRKEQKEQEEEEEKEEEEEEKEEEEEEKEEEEEEKEEEEDEKEEEEESKSIAENTDSAAENTDSSEDAAVSAPASQTAKKRRRDKGDDDSDDTQTRTRKRPRKK